MHQTNTLPAIISCLHIHTQVNIMLHISICRRPFHVCARAAVHVFLPRPGRACGSQWLRSTCICRRTHASSSIRHSRSWRTHASGSARDEAPRTAATHARRWLMYSSPCWAQGPCSRGHSSFSALSSQFCRRYHVMESLVEEACTIYPGSAVERWLGCEAQEMRVCSVGIHVSQARDGTVQSMRESLSAAGYRIQHAWDLTQHAQGSASALKSLLRHAPASCVVQNTNGPHLQECDPSCLRPWCCERQVWRLGHRRGRQGWRLGLQRFLRLLRLLVDRVQARLLERRPQAVLALAALHDHARPVARPRCRRRSGRCSRGTRRRLRPPEPGQRQGNCQCGRHCRATRDPPQPPSLLHHMLTQCSNGERPPVLVLVNVRIRVWHGGVQGHEAAVGTFRQGRPAICCGALGVGAVLFGPGDAGTQRLGPVGCGGAWAQKRCDRMRCGLLA